MLPFQESMDHMARNKEFQMSSDFTWKTWIMNRDFEEKNVCCGLGHTFHLKKPIFFALFTILVVILVFGLTKGYILF